MVRHVTCTTDHQSWGRQAFAYWLEADRGVWEVAVMSVRNDEGGAGIVGREERGDGGGAGVRSHGGWLGRLYIL